MSLVLIGGLAVGACVLAGGLVLVGYTILTYNNFVSLRNAAQSTFNQIRVAMKKRLDMIGQLVDATKGYMKYEKGVMENITKLRSGGMKLDTAEDVSKTHRVMTSFLRSFYAVMENYPDLKASTNVSKLMQEISDMETEIARLRYTYNNIVQNINTMCDTIPSNIVAHLFGIQKMDYLKFEDENLDKRPKIDLN